MKKSLTNYLRPAILTVLLLAGVATIQAAWTAPTCTPPNCNADAPLNVGQNTQTKLGALILNGSTTASFPVGLTVWGDTLLKGNVIIATGTPGAGKILTALDDKGTVGWVSPSVVAEKEYYFGGMYTIPTISGSAYPNALTGGQTCPQGYTAFKVLGSASDNDTFVCYGDSFSDTKVANFGGTYSPGNDKRPDRVNPITGGLSCPAGYRSNEATGAGYVVRGANGDWGLYYCYAPVTTPSVLHFGGMYSDIPGYPVPIYNNPITNPTVPGCSYPDTPHQALGNSADGDNALLICY